MITVRYNDTGKTEQVTNNVAFDLVERGIVEVVGKNVKPKEEEPKSFGYPTTAMHPGETKKYKIK